MTPTDEEFRAAWPRVVRTLAAWCGSLDQAEEHAAEAMARAVAHDGMIDDLAAWAVRVAQRSFVDAVRRRERLGALAGDLARVGGGALALPSTPEADVDLQSLPDDLDDRLALLFVACDDALPRAGQTVLALRVVCGLSIREIALHLGVEEPTAAARLTRAKKALAQARGRFAVPDAAQRRTRLPVVLDCVAAMFTVAHRDGFEPTDPLSDLGGQALSIADALARLHPDDPEVRGLRALVLLGLARRPGRVDDAGVAVTLDEVDRSRWDPRLLRAGLQEATYAAEHGQGRFTLEAAISGLHATAPSVATTDWDRIVSLYDALGRVWPSPAVEVARLVATTRASADPDVLARCEERLDRLTREGPSYVRRDADFALADLLWRQRRGPEAAERYATLSELASTEAVRRFCHRRAVTPP